MSIDVEGSEDRALAGIDLRRWRPTLLLLEATIPGTFIPCWEGWEPGLLAQGYRFAGADPANRYYVTEEQDWRISLF
jgi:hypothetical protein